MNGILKASFMPPLEILGEFGAEHSGNKCRISSDSGNVIIEYKLDAV